MSTVIGGVVVDIDARLTKLETSLAKADRDLNRFATRAQAQGNAIQRTTASMASSFARVTSAVAALGALAGAGFLANAVKQSLDYASSLSETSRQIGVTVEQLQILSRMALGAGASQETLERSMAKLNLTLGQAQTGSTSAQKAFTDLGFTPDQIARFSSGGDAIRVVAERITAIEDPARRAEAAVQVFGRAGQQLIPLLADIANGYDAAAAEAQRMGLLTTEQAARADEAKDAMDAFANSLQTRLAIAIADNIAPIQELIANLNDLIGAVSTGMGYLDSLRVGINNAQNSARSWLQTANEIYGGVTGNPNYRRAREGAQGMIGVSQTGGFLGGILGGAVPTLPTRRPASASAAALAAMGGSRGGGARRAGGGRLGGRSGGISRGPPRPGDVDDPRNTGQMLRDAYALEEAMEALRAAPPAELVEPMQVDAINNIARNMEGLAESVPEIPNLADILTIEDQQRLERFTGAFLEDITGGLADAVIYGEDLGDALVGSIKRAAAALLQTTLMDLLTGKGMGNGFASQLFGSIFGGGGIGKKASGGLAGGWNLVGERGPEIVKLPSGSNVIPNHGLKAANDAFSGASGGVVINQHFAPNFAGNAPTQEDLVRMAMITKQETLMAVREINRRRS